jgi:hypothetical protein
MDQDSWRYLAATPAKFRRQPGQAQTLASPLFYLRNINLLSVAKKRLHIKPVAGRLRGNQGFTLA